MESVTELCRRAAGVAPEVARLPGGVRDAALNEMADALIDAAGSLAEANSEDVERAREGGTSTTLIDRLTLTDKRIRAMADGMRAVADQPDPVGAVLDGWKRPNGLSIQKVAAPLGVVAVIYEARPNVTSDVAGLCLKSGNACILRGSRIALSSNIAIVEVLRRAGTKVGLPADAVQLVRDVERESALELMRAKGLIDLLVPRGGAELIRTIEENATVPYIIDGDGNCHVYVDKGADLDMATEIIVNAKTQRPSVCNAAETLLVHVEVADKWLPGALDALAARGVTVRGDERTRSLWPDARAATEADWGTEYLDLILAVRVVDSLNDAIVHVNRFGTSNAEAIITGDVDAARRFTSEVDSGTLFVNASTRFSDGGEFGYGAEIGISTQKLHARGPMGLKALTSAKYVVWGDGQVRT
ncbi:MAG TPA: glutamate-5-semialdehyde dehydrogenase [Actinomycetota bacterium]|jgi:glutamate-5-semialdehyde dehydrogenase|nr:glutamate-5-semialdehyde dehydrogenase [Actinomycetota bacterium]